MFVHACHKRDYMGELSGSNLLARVCCCMTAGVTTLYLCFKPSDVSHMKIVTQYVPVCVAGHTPVLLSLWQ